MQELQLRGLLPNVITYSAAISACAKCQKPQQALHLLQEMLLGGLLPNGITCNAAISACEWYQQPQQGVVAEGAAPWPRAAKNPAQPVFDSAPTHNSFGASFLFMMLSLISASQASTAGPRTFRGSGKSMAPSVVSPPAYWISVGRAAVSTLSVVFPFDGVGAWQGS